MPKSDAMPADHRAQCAAFLRDLRRTANVEASAHAVGLSRHTMVGRRKRFPAFAARWDAALAYARARLAERGDAAPKGNSVKTQGGEYTVSGSGNRPIQVRRAAPGRLSDAGETIFLAALAATANVRLACDTVGISPTAIYQRRMADDHFSDRMDAALEHGYERLELEMLEAATASLDPSQLRDWMDETAELPSPLLRMSFDQIVQLLGIHRKAATLREDRRAHNRRVYRAEETDAEITKLLDRLRKREEQKDARDERMAARGKGTGWE